ncbi:MAG TPA: tetratricopeptide repeat protein [Pyrinomonadaceae bacterium]|jgi:tetratricopeptide (TPR) repeat protein
MSDSQAAKNHHDHDAGRARLALCAALAALSLALAPAAAASAQAGVHTLYGDLKVDESKVSGVKPLSFDIILYTTSGTALARQSVGNNGRYRFLNLANGQYDVAVEVENTEVARVRVDVFSPFKNDFRRDIELEWHANPAEAKGARAATVSAADFYKRTPPNQSTFKKAEEAIDRKNYAAAAALLEQLVAADAQDFQAWAELGTARLFQDKPAEAERAYLRAVEVKPAFTLAYVNLGRLRMAQKNYDGAVEALGKAVTLGPPSAEANYLLGESYLQLKRGSKAVPHFTEAIRLGKSEGHLRLAALYNAAGLKDRAAAEYEQFLAKNPDHPDRKKFEQYVKENRKR